MTGLLVTLDGADGAGKTTITAAIVAELNRRGHQAHNSVKFTSCDSPVKYVGQDAVRADIENLRWPCPGWTRWGCS